ncbi:formamidopyrimidine-DNA glycosylase isoform X1 [Phoenix dactylifera]|uniref:Formamidopyrimidine-DNA glycosylase isoform X1 n=1 Tax=Phoenix dactylifera TaxID=42345 RepID=A0A8B9AEA8_PHODC|nr:formamidopyrimidine-DNA glycosylase isoform X1 [Phoenix dactylifera]
MPELPEVEAARRAIEEHCLGKKITRCSAAEDPKVIDGVSPSDFESSLVGKTILAALRKGKNLWLRLDSPPFPTFQFGMTGAIYIKGVAVTKYKRSAVSSTDEWPSKYSKVFIELDDGLELSFTDKRRFAKVRLLEDPESVPPISELGPDALNELMQVNEFVDSLSKKKIAIKALLLDQSYISGIGNWIADEVLYQARIHPLQIASSLSRESCESLHRCMEEVSIYNHVIQLAVEVDADSSHFPIEWLFHFRWGKKFGKVNGKKIDFITAGGRTSAYVPELQKLKGNQSEKVRQSKSRKVMSDKNSHDQEESESSDREEEESKEAPKSKKSENATGGTKKRQKKLNDADDNGDKPQKPTKGRTKKQANMAKNSSNKRTKSGQASPPQKRKARK